MRTPSEGRATGSIADASGGFCGAQLTGLRVRRALRRRILGLTVESLGGQVRHALYGLEAQDLQIGDEEVTVRVVVPEDARRGLADLDRLRLLTPSGRRVPLGEVVDVTTTRGYASLHRIDGKRAVTISADVDADVANVRGVTEDLQGYLGREMSRHPGVELAFEGRQKETTDSMRSLGIGFPASLLAIFSIIAVIFRCTRSP